MPLGVIGSALMQMIAGTMTSSTRKCSPIGRPSPKPSATICSTQAIAKQHRPAEHAREEARLFAEGVARLDAAHQHVALGQLGQERLKLSGARLVGPAQNDSTTTRPLAKSMPRTTSITAMKRCWLITTPQLARAISETKSSIANRPSNRSTTTVVTASAFFFVVSAAAK